MTTREAFICDISVGAPAITLTLADPNTTIYAFEIVRLLVNYTATEPELVSLPLILQVRAPSPENFRRTVFRRVVPSELFFKPVEGGIHTIALREAFNNHWYGAIEVNVQGDELRI